MLYSTNLAVTSHTHGGVPVVRILTGAVALAVACTGATLSAQATGRGSAPKKSVAPPRTSSVRIAIKDQNEANLSGVRLLLSGAGTGEFTTGAAGTAVVPNLKDGMYRVRCEREGFVTLEREFTLRGGAWNPIDIVLNAAPPPPAPPPPPKPAPEPPPPSIPPSGPPVTMSIVDFLDRNSLGRMPIREAGLCCRQLGTIR